MKKLLFLITLTLILIPTKISALNNIFDNYIVMDIDSKRIFEEKNKEGYYKGHTQNYILVEYKTNKELENQIVKVNIKKSEIEYVIG